MIVGDSIAAGPGCFKKYLDEQLQAGGITNYEFVGAYDDDCGGGVKHSAVSCSTAEQYTQEEFTLSNCTPAGPYDGMARLVQTYTPDLILLQLGVNDIWGGGTAVQTVLDRYTTLVEQARANHPNIVIAVAQIHKINTSGDCNDSSPPDTRAQELVDAVPAWAESMSSQESPLIVADLWTNSEVSETNDCVHPDEAGAQRMASNWFAALKDILN
jgi:lysophospholipase L1-like esterase